jgi:hypothetical protein
MGVSRGSEGVKSVNPPTSHPLHHLCLRSYAIPLLVCTVGRGWMRARRRSWLGWATMSSGRSLQAWSIRRDALIGWELDREVVLQPSK